MKLYYVLLFACVSLIGCQAEQEDSPPLSAQDPSVSRSIIVRDEKGVQVAKVGLHTISFKGNTVSYKYGSSGKRKYLNQAGQTVAKIKRTDTDRFKLKSESGVLLWKVKRSQGSIKIANNENMQGAYKVKPKGKGRAKVLIDEQPQFEIRLDQGKAMVNSEGSSFEVNANDAISAAILGLEDISMLHRLIIIKELAE